MRFLNNLMSPFVTTTNKSENFVRSVPDPMSSGGPIASSIVMPLASGYPGYAQPGNLNQSM